MKDNMRVEFKMEQTTCNDCKKSSAEYYELKLQIRFDYFTDREILEEKKNSVEKLVMDRFKSLNKMEEVDNGFDFYFRHHGEMNKISGLFNKRYFFDETRTKKIVAHDFLRSKDLWRHTQLLRIVDLEKGDHVSLKGEEYYIKAFNKNDLVLRNLINGSKKVVTYGIVKDYLKLTKKRDKLSEEELLSDNESLNNDKNESFDNEDESLDDDESEYLDDESDEFSNKEDFNNEDESLDDDKKESSDKNKSFNNNK